MKLGLIQLCSAIDPAKNLQKLHSFLTEAKSVGVEAIFLPELFYSLAYGVSPLPHLVEKDNEHFCAIARLARDYQIYLLGGSASTKLEDKVVNRAYNFAPDGTLLGIYDKMHLFSCDLPGKDGHRIDEADIFFPGKERKIVEVGPLRVGLSICFDLRFPELYRAYAKEGANLISISAAFTVPTGRAHWHTLVRARAIENQIFVVATGQWGKHNENTHTFGHSLIVDPWGEILVDAGEGEKLVVQEIDLEKIKEVRKKVKMF